MALTPEQVKELKEQLKQQVQNLPEDKKAIALQQIDSLSPQALEEMLNQQRQRPKNADQQEEQKSIFRLIAEKKVSSIIADENNHAIAVLDINPISKAHILIIPKQPVQDIKSMPTQAFSLAKKLAKRISSKLKAKSTEIQTENKLGETIINLIPIYDQPLDQNSPRQKAAPEDLEKIAKQIRPLKKSPIKKTIKAETQKGEVIKLPRRIP